MDNFAAVESIFFAALEKNTPEERAAYLDLACGHDPELRASIERLLRAEPKVGHFLQAPAPGLPATAAAHLPAEGPGTRIGPYKLLQQIGEGGMGVVYMADQEQPVKRRVALKIIKPGMDSGQVVARFEAERQALALMDHQNIARVLDAGTTETGRPYFVMELVHGVPITKFCDDNRLTPRERLELFVPVCQAIQHAHQKGIIHRDVKPTNVLVTMYDDKPVPKVIDFGVAKAVEQRLTEKTLFTQFGALVGTFEYMSPEQAEMNAFGVDTRSDLYSLGVLLYELLTGTTPLERRRLREAALDELVRLIKEEEPPRPSVRLSASDTLAKIAAARKTEPARLSKLVRGEIDWIVMKCLEKDRSRRYETASGLARDVERYLHDEAVEACPPSAGYRLRKFVRKQKKALGTAAAFAALLLAGAVVSAWQAVRATLAEGAAKEQRDAATAAEQVATRQRDETRDANVRLEAAQGQLRLTLYGAHLNLAQAAWEANDVGRVRDLLVQTGLGAPDLRGFEWYYWQRRCHTELLTLTGHTNIVTSVAFSPDGRLLASAGGREANTAAADNTIRVWDAVSGRPIRVITGPGGPASALAFTPDGKGLTGAWGQTVKVCDLTTGEVTSTITLEGQITPAGTAMTFSPDGQRLASAWNVWDVATGRQVFSRREGDASAWGGAVSPDGKRLAGASASEEQTVEIWDVTTGRRVFSLRGHGATVLGVAFSPDGKRLASSAVDKTVKVWDADAGRELLTLKGHTGPVVRVAFSPDGKRLATASHDRTVKVWDADAGRELLTLKGHTGLVFPIAFSPDGTRLATASSDRTVRVWDATTDPQVLSFQAHGVGSSRRNLAFSPDGTRLASSCHGEDVRVWDPATGHLLQSLRGLRGVYDVAFSPDGNRLAGGGADATNPVKVWDTATGREMLSLKWPMAAVHCLAFSPDGNRLAGGSWSSNPRPGRRGEIKVWDAVTGRESLSFTGHDAIITGVAFSPDGRLLASAAGDAPGTHPSDTTVAVWDVTTGQQVFSLQGHGAAVWRVAFSPDGKCLASASFDGTVNVWDVGTGQVILSLKGHTGWVWAVAFSPDGRRLVSASSDQTIKVWNAQSGQELLTLKGHTYPVVSAVFSPNGNRLASADSNGVVKIWDATPLPEEPAPR